MKQSNSSISCWRGKKINLANYGGPQYETEDFGVSYTIEVPNDITPDERRLLAEKLEGEVTMELNTQISRRSRQLEAEHKMPRCIDCGKSNNSGKPRCMDCFISSKRKEEEADRRGVPFIG